MVSWPLEGYGIERGVENRERAWFFGLLNTLMPKRASDFPSEIFSLGKFHVPARYLPREGPSNIGKAPGRVVIYRKGRKNFLRSDGLCVAQALQ